MNPPVSYWIKEMPLKAAIRMYGVRFNLRKVDCAKVKASRKSADNAEIGKTRHFYFRPSTSCMSYNPGAFPTTHWAARTEPRENMSRVMARWEISIRSPMPMK
ncbi:hypothetical protein GSUET_01350 [Geobacter sulfurreducens subsp. ethanolicus]|nr:hypothetical protein GSUET_01350 [Geobacter sulfurreducens subsp. ethanolicus]